MTKLFYGPDLSTSVPFTFVPKTASVELGKSVSFHSSPALVGDQAFVTHTLGAGILTTYVVAHTSFIVFWKDRGLDNLCFWALIAYYIWSSYQGFQLAIEI